MSQNTYKNGIWIWDKFNNGVMFQSKDAFLSKVPSQPSVHPSTSIVSGKKNLDMEMRLMVTSDAYTQLRFKKLYQRKVKSTDPAVVTIQDVKDVAIFMTKVQDLTPEFISFFHTMSMDRFLRSMIVYFQYYLQTWEQMQFERTNEARKVRHPIVTILENEIRDNLADLRSVASKNYAALLLGMEDSKQYHHMSNKNNDSLSDRDRRMYEMLYLMTVKVIWIGSFRKSFSLIEKETDRLFRSLHFSLVEHSEIYEYPKALASEERVLVGRAFKKERQLLQKSPMIQEIIYDDHEYGILSIGVKNIQGADKRVRYLEIAYTAPEEYLVDNSIAVGVLGVARKYVDPLLKPHELSTTVKRHSFMEIGVFKLPKKSEAIRWIVSDDTIRTEPANYQETNLTVEARKQQCKMWRKYIETGGAIPAASEMESDSIGGSSVLTLLTL